jgi:pyruvate kinase
MPMSDLQNLRDAIESLRAHVRATEHKRRSLVEDADVRYRASARNLLHYLAVRGRDLRPLQQELARLGLSSLGRLEGHVLDTLTAVRDRLDDALARAHHAPPVGSFSSVPVVTADDAEALLHRHTRELLGPRPGGRHVYIMVTAPAQITVDDAWAERILDAGVNVLRINGAHEAPWQWTHIFATVRRVADRRGTPLKLLVDLPGPKLRTLLPGAGPRVARWRPTRDVYGRTLEPCRVELHASGTAPRGQGPALAVPEAMLAKLAPGDRLALSDTRDRRRHFDVASHPAGGLVAELDRTAFVEPGTKVTAWRGDHRLGRFVIESVPERERAIDVVAGQNLRVVGPERADDRAGAVPTIAVSAGEALAALAPGQRVLFDDGKLSAVVTAVDHGGATVHVTHAAGGRVRLRGEKSVNLPDTTVDLPALSADDERALAFAAAHADLVGASFVRDASDVRALYRRLAQVGAERLGVVLKIETTQAFRALPEILTTAMTRYPVGVMIARGDLAVEAGFERLAELQEEILWLCESAHLPVVWATQVLDGLARTGQASRAEITDAAMAVRAECVMLNKGPYIAEAVRVLDDILRRMEQHQYKKRSLFRPLSVAIETDTFDFADAGGARSASASAPGAAGDGDDAAETAAQATAQAGSAADTTAVAAQPTLGAPKSDPSSPS